MPETQILDVKKLVGAWLPKTLKVANGDTFQIKWHDEDEYHPREDAPYGTFRVMSINPGRTVKSFKREQRLLDDTDTFTYAAATPFYQVETKDIVEVVSLTGTRLGSPYTFVKDTDFEVTSSPNYTLITDCIKWLDGGLKPDEGTSFTLAYKYPLYDIYYAQYSSLTFRLTIHATELRSGQRGATKDYAKSRLCGELWEALSGFLALKKGANLGPTAGSFIFFSLVEINVMRTDKGESIAKKSIDLLWTRRQEVFEQTVTRIGSAPAPVTPG